MSVAVAWLMAHAINVSELSGGQLWSLPQQYSLTELGFSLGCAAQYEHQNTLWCITADALWLVNTVQGTQYVRSFSHKVQRPSASLHHQWFGQRIERQVIDGYSLSTYSSPHDADTIVRGFRFRNSTRIKFHREIEHGRYHLVTQKPEQDVFIVQQGETTFTFIIQVSRAKPH